MTLTPQERVKIFSLKKFLLLVCIFTSPLFYFCSFQESDDDDDDDDDSDIDLDEDDQDDDDDDDEIQMSTKNPRARQARQNVLDDSDNDF